MFYELRKGSAINLDYVTRVWVYHDKVSILLKGERMPLEFRFSSNAVALAEYERIMTAMSNLTLPDATQRAEFLKVARAD